MRAEAIEKLISRPVKDIYGRYVGFVVGFSVETSGDLMSIGVDQGNGVFAEYPSSRLVSAADGFIIIPSWKVECDSLAKETDGVRKRAKALQELAREGEVPRTLFDEMTGKYTAEAEKIQESYRTLAQEMVVRTQELDLQRETLERFLVNLKVQFRSGELDEPAYKVASENCQNMQKKNALEREELVRMMKFVTGPMGEQTQNNTAAAAPVQTVAQPTTQ
jgi:hypothetical protein